MKKLKQLIKNLRYLSTVDLKKDMESRASKSVVNQLCKFAVLDGKMIFTEHGGIMRQRTTVE